MVTGRVAAALALLLCMQQLLRQLRDQQAVCTAAADAANAVGSLYIIFSCCWC